MDDNEYLSIKYKICLKNDEASSLSSSVSSIQPNEQQQQSPQQKFKQYHSSISDQSIDTQQWQHSKYKAMPSSGQLNQTAIRTSSTGTNADLVHSSNKSSQTNYFRDIDPCMNCSNLLIYTAEFLTKIELNYGLRPITLASNLNNFKHYTTSTTSTERSLKNKRRFARRKAGDVSNIPISVFSDKVIPITSSSEALLIRHTNKSDQKLNSTQREKTDKLTAQNISQVEEDITTPLDWMLSSKEKRMKAKEKSETDKSKNEKKGEQNNAVKNEANIESKLENREKGQKKCQQVVVENDSMTLGTAMVDSAATKKVQPEAEKIGEPVAITPTPKDISNSDKKTTSDDRKNSNGNQKEIDKKVKTSKD